MNKPNSTALALTVAVALSAGGVLVEHPLYTDPAPRAYSDITIAEADNQKISPESADKTAKPAPSAKSSADVPPAIETTPGEESKGTPPRKP